MGSVVRENTASCSSSVSFMTSINATLSHKAASICNQAWSKQILHYLMCFITIFMYHVFTPTTQMTTVVNIARTNVKTSPTVCTCEHTPCVYERQKDVHTTLMRACPFLFALTALKLIKLSFQKEKTLKNKYQ